MSGAFLTLGSVGRFDKLMTNGRGFIALAAMIFGNWNPFGAFGASLLFGFMDSLQLKLQILTSVIPSEFLLMAPYLATMIVLAGVVAAVTLGDVGDDPAVDADRKGRRKPTVPQDRKPEAVLFRVRPAEEVQIPARGSFRGGRRDQAEEFRKVASRDPHFGDGSRIGNLPSGLGFENHFSGRFQMPLFGTEKDAQFPFGRFRREGGEPEGQGAGFGRGNVGERPKVGKVPGLSRFGHGKGNLRWIGKYCSMGT